MNIIPKSTTTYIFDEDTIKRMIAEQANCSPDKVKVKFLTKTEGDMRETWQVTYGFEAIVSH